jgi:DNA-binding LytR/AlgR family response regulator
MNVIIVDDEPLALDVLETYAERLPQLKLLQRCNNALEANEALNKHEVHLMFLDVQMPQLTGIELLKSLHRPPMVVFTTAFPNYAIEGFDLNAVDYLLKPISFERFIKAVNKAQEQHDLHHSPQPAASATSDPLEGDDFFFVKSDKKLVKVKFDEIIYIEGLKDYVIIRMEAGRVITLQTMKSLEDRLPTKQFRRIHRSFIVALDRIEAIDGNMVEVTEKREAKHLPIGKNYRDELLDIINKNRI